MMKQTDKTVISVKKVAGVLGMVCAAMCSTETDNWCAFLAADKEYNEPWEESCEYSLNLNLNGFVGSGGEEQGEGETLTLTSAGPEETEEEHPELERRGGEKRKGEDESEGEEEESEGERERRGRGKKPKKKKAKSKKCQEWMSEVPLYILPNTTVEKLERVIEANKQALHEIYEAHIQEQEKKAGCKTGSLEWIERAKEVLKEAANTMGKEEGERELTELLKSAVKVYEKELEDRERVARAAMTKWIPEYRKAFDALLKEKETVASLFTSGNWDAKVYQMAKDSNVPFNSYTMIVKVLQKGLEDLEMGRPIRDIRRSDAVTRKLVKRREFRSELCGTNRERTYTGLEHHVKNTLFYPVIAALWYNHLHSQPHRGKKLSISSVTIYAKVEECESTLRYLEARRRDLEETLCSGAEGEGEGEREQSEEKRNSLREIQELIASRREKGRLLSDICRRVENYVLEYKASGAEMHSSSYLEVVETYLIGEDGKRDGKRDGRLEETLKALYKMMEESGHLENVRKRRRGEDAAKNYLKDEYKLKIMRQWMNAIDIEVIVIRLKLKQLELKPEDSRHRNRKPRKPRKNPGAEGSVPRLQ